MKKNKVGFEKLYQLVKFTPLTVFILLFSVTLLGVGVYYAYEARNISNLSYLEANAGLLDLVRQPTSQTSNLATLGGVALEANSQLQSSSDDVCNPNFQTVGLGSLVNVDVGNSVRPEDRDKVVWRVIPDPASPAFPTANSVQVGASFASDFKTLGNADIMATYSHPLSGDITETCKVRVVADVVNDANAPTVKYYRGVYPNWVEVNEIYINKYEPVALTVQSRNFDRCDYKIDAFPPQTSYWVAQTVYDRNYNYGVSYFNLSRSATAYTNCTGKYGSAYGQVVIHIKDDLCEPVPNLAYITKAKTGEVVKFKNGGSVYLDMKWDAPEGTPSTGYGKTFETVFKTVGKNKKVTASFQANGTTYSESCLVDVEAGSSLQEEEGLGMEPALTAPPRTNNPFGRQDVAPSASTGGWSSVTRFLRGVFR